MREEFVDPLPSVQLTAKLVMRNQQFVCYIVEFSIDGFRVAVPGGTRYEGNHQLILLSNDKAFPVRIVCQEAHAGGYSYQLELIKSESLTKSDSIPISRRHRLAKPVCAVGLVAAVVASFYCGALNGDRGSQRTRESVSETWHNQSDDHNGLKSSIVVLGQDIEIQDSNPERQTFSVISHASMSAHESVDESIIANDPALHNGRSNKPAHSRSAVTLKSLLEEGLVGRIQPMTKSLVPWLYGSSESSEPPELRMSDAAWFDLKQFERGLQNLPKSASADAIGSLRRVLHGANSNSSNIRTVPGFSDIKFIESDDATVYFRTVRARIELVRVLPIDLNRSE